MLLPQLNIWIYLLACVGFLVLGFMLTFGIYYIGSRLNEWRLKRKMPKDLRDPIYLNPGKPGKLTEKEVEENERTQFSRIRQFEKLRRFAEQDQGIRGIKAAVGVPPGKGEELRRELLPDESSTKPIEYRDKNGLIDKGKREGGKSPSFTRPEFL